MTRKNIAELAFMIGGAYMLILSIITLIEFGGILFSMAGGNAGGSFPTLGMAISLSVPYAIFGVLFIRKADWFADRLLKEHDKSEQTDSDAAPARSDATLGTSRFQAILFSMVAIFFIASGVTGLISGFWSFFVMSIHEGDLRAQGVGAREASMISHWWIYGVSKLAVGLFIFLKAGSLSDWWHRLRGWDAYPAAPQTPQASPEGNPE